MDKKQKITLNNDLMSQIIEAKSLWGIPLMWKM